MTEPLALVVYEKLLPGSQLVNRLQDLKYRVQTVSDIGLLVECTEQTKPMLILADLRASHQDVCAAIGRLKQNPSTQHVPVIAFGAEEQSETQKAALAAGVTLIVSESALLNHLPQCLDQALRIE
ncbi:MAG TPA: response regulator [Patescibacteria group bacterium]|nr:response regulator [Patescibacteria group bacterium]